MKNIILLATCAASISAYALPTYEPFTEYSITTSTNSIDLCTGGYTAPSGESWLDQKFSATSSGSIAGYDIQVTNATAGTPSTIFSYANLVSSGPLLPATFPGMPTSGNSIHQFLMNPAQSNALATWVGNSAVLQFASDITRPASGTKTLFISYLVSVAQAGQTGSGNFGRYLDFVASSNIVEPGAGGTIYKNWTAMFNGFGVNNTNRYFGHAVYTSNGVYNFLPADSSAGKAFTINPPGSGSYTQPFPNVTFNLPYFIVGEYVLVSTSASAAGTKDTNIMWVNPTTLGGATPATGSFAFPMAITMNDVDGLVIEDRVGSGSLGGVGTNYIANLMLGSTWSYVTGGPEFTTQPANVSGSGSTVTLSAVATAPGQSVAYQWQHVTGSGTINVTSTAGGAGGAATVTGATSSSMTLANMDAADTAGSYQVVATASSTGYSLTSQTATVTTDPLITVEPANTTAPLGGNASFSITAATTASPPLSFQWSLNGVNINNGQTLGDGSTVTVVSGSTTSSLTIGNYAADENGASITCGVTNNIPVGEISAAATLATADPAMTSQPSPTTATVNYGATGVTFTASISTAHPGLSYAWYHGSTVMMNGSQPGTSSATGAQGSTGGTSLTSTLTLNSVSYLDDGSYTLEATNGLGGTVTSAAATLTVTDPYIITQPPATVEVAVNGSANISVSANGTSPSYQWNNVPGTGDYTGTTGSTLMLANAQSGDAGTVNVTINGSSGQPVTSTTTTIIVENPVTAVTVGPPALTQQVGTHLALVGTVTGGAPLVHLQWMLSPVGGGGPVSLANGTQADGSWISGATATAIGSGTTTLVLSNIQVLDSGTYTLTAANAAGSVTSSSTSVLTVSAALLPLSTANLEVTRVGEGSQTLSGATGNTLYLDQFTTSGGYVSTIMVPDSGGSTLIVPGAGADSTNEAYMTLSSNNAYLNFIGYFQQYPYGGASVTAGGVANPRAIGAVNGVGYYVEAYTNEGIDSGGGAYVRDVFSTDGLTNFWVTGAAGSAAVKYVNAGPQGSGYATGSGVPGLSDAVNGPTCIGLCGANLVYSDWYYDGGTYPGMDTNGIKGTSLGPPYAAAGLDIFSGAPEVNPASGGATNLIYYGSPADFAFSPDQLTVYFADFSYQIAGGTSYGGGVQRYDWNGSAYQYSYTLQDTTGAALTNGLRGLTVYFPTQTYGQGADGAVIYATTSEAVGNRLITFTDTGLGSASSLLDTAGPNQFFRGVRFGPAQLSVAIVTQPQGVNTYVGQNYTLTVAVTGDAPLTYQWEFDNGSGPVAIGSTLNGATVTGATTSSMTLTGLQTTDTGTYTVVVNNLVPSSQTSSGAAVSVTAGPAALVAGPQSLQETVGDHTAFNINVTGSQPIYYQWTSNGTVIATATTSSFSLTNITLLNSGTYTVTYWNQFSTMPYSTASATLQVTTGLQSLSSGNLVVARIGDGVQTLTTNGNTVYLDQYTTAGASGYVNTIMIPDNAAARGNLVAPGDSLDGPLGSVLTLSANNTFLNFVGFNIPYNIPEPTLNGGAGNTYRSIAAVNAIGYFEVAQDNETAYDAIGNEIFNCAASKDGYAEFWMTGFSASGGGLKYATAAQAGAAGGNVAVGGSAGGTRVANIVAGNVVYSDTGSSPAGIYGYVGEPTATTTPTLLITDAAGNPNDFAASPDTTAFPPTTSTVYVGDSTSIAGGGGIQRYDWNGAAYALSYTLGTGTGSTVGASCLTVDFSAAGTWGTGITGAIIYATTAGASGNQLIKVVDNGNPNTTPPTITTLVQAYANELLRGVRFSPVASDPIIVTSPQPVTQYIGDTAIFTVAAQNGPVTYQWFGPCGQLADNPAADPCGGGAVITGSQTTSLTLANIGVADAGTYDVEIINANGTTTTTPVMLTVPTVAASIGVAPISMVETVGDHTALNVTAAGTPPFFYSWTSNGTVIGTATTSSFSLTNIDLTSAGPYVVTVWNQFNTLPYPTATANLQVTTTLQPMSPNNLEVARVGDGVQALTTNGNTVYLDQYTTAGASGYVNTIMIPDNAAAGGNLVAPGSAPEGTNGSVLTLSANDTFLNLVGFDIPYNIPEPTLNGGAGNTYRSFEAVNAFGYYEVAETNETIYDAAGNEVFNAAASQDGFAEFWTTGAAGSGNGLKYATAATSGGAGGIPSIGGSLAGTRVVNIVAGNVVYSDTASSPVGIWRFTGEPIVTTAPTALITDAAGSPNDFAFSPDTTTFPPNTSTAYVGDSSKTGGIQRYDWNGSAYALSYTLATGGVSCLTVDFSANATWGTGVTGAIIYATTAGASGNQLISVVDNGAGSTATVLVQAYANEILRGVRFTPAQSAPIIATSPQPQSEFVGGTAIFTVAAQNGPITGYQWQWNGQNLADYPTPDPSGSGAVITGSQTASLTVANVGPLDDQGSYTVEVSNPFPTPTPTAPVLLSVPVKITASPPVLEYVVSGGTAYLTVTATGGTPGGVPLTYQWNGPCGPITSDGSDTCNGSVATISGSSTAMLTLSGVTAADNGAYYVTVSNPDPSSATSSAAPSVLTVVNAPQFNNGYITGLPSAPQLNFMGTAGTAYSIWGSSVLTETVTTPLWTKLTSGTFSGGNDSYMIPLPIQYQFYVITQP